MDKKLIERINFLANKSKTQSLTEEEKKEQQELRQRYLAEWRQGFRQTIENVVVVDKFGNKTKIVSNKKNKDDKPLN